MNDKKIPDRFILDTNEGMTIKFPEKKYEEKEKDENKEENTK